MTGDWKILQHAEQLHCDAVVWDMVWPLEPWCGNDWDKLSRFRAAGIDVLSVTLAGDNHNIGQAVQRIAAARRRICSEPDDLRLVESVEDVHAAKCSGRLAVALHLEGTRCFERNLDMVEAFYQLGIRHTLLAFNQANSAGGGCAEKADGGLTRFGVELVREMNRVGMLLDLSHTGRRTSLEALEGTGRPAVFTHSNAAALAPHFRNLDDEQARACAATGGLVGVSSSSEYLGVEHASPEAIFAHIDHWVERVGPRHVGLGLDIVFDAEALSAWIRTRPEEWPGTDSPDWPGFNYATPEAVPRLTELMLDHGYADDDVRAILGGNYLRICGEVWT